MSAHESVTLTDYQTLATFRYRLRQFLSFSERNAKGAGLEPQQQQLMLAVKGLPPDQRPTIGTVAERLQIRHHSAVELLDRLVKKGLVERYREERGDRRQVLVRLTAAGEEVLKPAVSRALAELQSTGSQLMSALGELMMHADSLELANPDNGHEIVANTRTG
jgi:DNA-binding MarR family transcriptional regulator